MPKSICKSRLGDSTVISSNSDGLSPEEIALVQGFAEHKASERRKTTSTITVVPCTCRNTEYKGQAHVHFMVTQGTGADEEVKPFGPVFLRPTGKALLQQLERQGFITPQQVEETIPILEKHIQAEHMVWPPNPALDRLEEAWINQHQVDNICQPVY